MVATQAAIIYHGILPVKLCSYQQKASRGNAFRQPSTLIVNSTLGNDSITSSLTEGEQT